MKSEKYIITSPKFLSGFALGNNSIYVVAFVKYQNYEIMSSVALFVSHDYASRRYLFYKKLQNSCVFENFDDFVSN